jgi:hypothetical protein
MFFFGGMKPTRIKICINNRLLGQMNNFNNLGYTISCVEDKDLSERNVNFLTIQGSESTVLIIQRKEKYHG